MQETEKVTFYGQTDTGRQRQNNEDAFIARRLWDDQHVLAVVIDGLGGYAGGEVAAGIACEEIAAYLERYADGERLQLLKQAVVWANNRIWEVRRRRPDVPRMGCVLTAVLVELEAMRINMVHVGDTRLYQYAGGSLVKLSHDMSLVGYQEEKGLLTEEEAMQHPERNIIDRDLGSYRLENDDTDYMETAVFPFVPGSQLMLCSDGLCDMITSARMAEVLSTEVSVEQKVATLIEAANRAGGKDNVTVVLLQVAGQEGTEQEAAEEEAAEQEATEEESVFVDDRVTVTESERHPEPPRERMSWGPTVLAVVLILWAVLSSVWR